MADVVPNMYPSPRGSDFANNSTNFDFESSNRSYAKPRTVSMADPFGIIGVIGVATQIFQVLSQFAQDWKDAPADVESFLNELQALKSCLSETNTNLIMSKDFNEAFQGERSALLAELGDANQAINTSLMIASCQAALDGLLVKLKDRARGHRGWERIKGALLAKKIRDTVENLDRRCQTLNRLVVIDAAKLASIT